MPKTIGGKTRRPVSRSYYDDNYGWYDVDGPDDVDFYHSTQRASVWKRCARCNRRVKLRSDYAICNSCATKLEQGYDY